MSEALAEALPETRAAQAWARARAWRPVALGLLAAIACTFSWLQYARPYIEHDDYDMLLPDGVGFVIGHAHRVLTEGRWLNYWFWRTGSSSLDVREAVILFAVAWLLVVGVTVRALDIGWWSVPAAVALFASPMTSEISYWPTTLTPACWALALTLLALWGTRGRWATQLVVVAVGTIVIALGYPTIALFLIPMLVVLHHTTTWRRLSVLGAVFVGAYVVGLLLVFALNDLYFNYFGIRIGNWRHPTPLNGVPALAHHLSVFASDWWSWLGINALPALAAGIALVVALIDERLRRQIVVLLLALVVAVGLNAAPTILRGTSIPYRATGWAWPFLVIVTVWALGSSRRIARRTGAVALVLIAVWGSAYCVSGEVERYHHQGALRAFNDQIIATADANHTRSILLLVKAKEKSPQQLQTMWLIGNSLSKTPGGVTVDRTHDWQYWRILAYARLHHLQGPLFTWRHQVVVQFPASLVRWVEISRPRWVEPFVPKSDNP